MADALDLDALEARMRAGKIVPTPPLLALIARCRAAEQRAADAEGQVAAVRWLPDKWHADAADHPSTNASGAMARCAYELNVALAEATPERVILTEDPTVGAIETADGAR